MPKSKLQSALRYCTLAGSTVMFAMLAVNTSFAGEDQIIEKPADDKGYLHDSWVINYKADDFTDKVKEASMLYIPADYSQQAAVLFRCMPFFTNVKMNYVEHQNNLMEDGELPNASSKFAKHGFIYDDKQRMTVKTEDDDESYRLSVGGQNRYLTKMFKTDVPKTDGLLGMSWFYSFTYEEMPSFRHDPTSDDARDFYNQLKQAINNQQNISFELEAATGHKRTFELDSKRMQQVVPAEVIEFCITKRKLK